MTFTASNGMRVWRQGTSVRVQGVFPDPLVIPGLDSDALREFFEHEANHKPWHDAKSGEVWVLTVDGVESAFYPSKSLDRCFTPVAPNSGTTAIPFDWPEITDARRIYPEADSE